MIRRSLAYLVDMLLLFLVLAPIGFLIQRVIGRLPQSGPQIWGTLLWNFSIPVWLYFTLSDKSSRGATLGKRILNLQVARTDNRTLTTWNALLRTGVKLLPWELTHVSAFAMSAELNDLSYLQIVGLILANVLAISYFVIAVATRGRRSLHDFVAQTEVRGT